MEQRHYSPLDRLIAHLDQGLRTVFGAPQTTGRPNPARDFSEAELRPEEKTLAGRLMRVNHAGEVAAQGLYQGQALTARLPDVRDKMERAAQEENDHLAWCAQRCHELGTHTSVLDPLWYVGSVAIGAAAGALGDKWSLGFLAETEHQVVAHLEGHLQRLPAHDAKSRAILTQMKIDEGAHATTALQSGGAKLPYPVQQAMRLASKVMTETAYRI
jgi:ubiquinone biosynthesis monooxygenase Coq7